MDKNRPPGHTSHLLDNVRGSVCAALGFISGIASVMLFGIIFLCGLMVIGTLSLLTVGAIAVLTTLGKPKEPSKNSSET